MFERYTERARRVGAFAQAEASSLGHAHTGPEHLLVALVREQEGLAGHVLGDFGVSLDELRSHLAGRGDMAEADASGQPPFDVSAGRVFDDAVREALRAGVHFVGTEHLLLALTYTQSGVQDVLAGLGLDCEHIRADITGRIAEASSIRGLTVPVDGDLSDFSTAEALLVAERLLPVSCRITFEARSCGKHATCGITCVLNDDAVDTRRDFVALAGPDLRVITVGRRTVRLARSGAGRRT